MSQVISGSRIPDNGDYLDILDDRILALRGILSAVKTILRARDICYFGNATTVDTLNSIYGECSLQVDMLEIEREEYIANILQKADEVKTAVSRSKEVKK